MQNRPSQDPRDIVRRAAMNDAASLAGMLVDEFEATYQGPDRTAYLAALASWVADLGGEVEDDAGRAAVRFAGRRIAIRFGPVSGHTG
jgi:hypothetical protein